ncbi:MAG: hypothetical protein IIY12_05085 [Clostridia bacterium]|nr:hypothetical protein [Clostridia bacterium]MBQ5743152.1 hypothetical protein [Clostridia bacterium]
MKLKHYGIALVPICLVAFLFRAAELILSIDPNTGYYVSGSVFPYLFDGFLILAALFFVSVLFTKKEPKPPVVKLFRASLFDTVIGIAGSVLLITAALYQVFSAWASKTLVLDKSLVTNPALWQLVFAIMAAVFLIFFVTYPRLSAKQNGWRVMSLSLTAYYLFLLLINFRDLTVVFSRCYGIYLIAFYGVAAAVGINFSKILARLFGRKGFTLFACLMALMAAVRLADGVLYLIPGNPYAIPFDLFGFLADCCITALMLSQMSKLMKKRKKKRPAEAAEGELSEEPEAPEAAQ